MINYKDMISDVKVYGLEESVRASKYPMAVDVDKVSNVENISYWFDLKDFLNDFYNYQNNYNKPVGMDTNCNCYFCGSSLNVQKNNKFGHYLCSKHNHQYERYGECFETKPKYEIFDDRVECTIYGDKRKETKIIINAIDLPIVFYSDGINVSSDGYVKLYDKASQSHKLFTRTVLNIDDENIIVDHKDNNPTNNIRTNLRIGNSQDNNRNESLSKNNTSGIIGVSWSKEKNRWRTYIMIDRKQKFLGYYINKNDAITSRLLAEKEYFKEYAPQKNLFQEYGIEPIKENIDNTDYNKDFKAVFQMYKVSKNLANSAIGSGHSNYLKGIVVQFDLKMSVKMSVELQRYNFIDFVSSQSTMHKITQFDLDKAYINYVDKRIIEIMKEKVEEYRSIEDKGSDRAKELYLEILYSNPCGMQLTARMTTNYQQLKTIYSQRRFHRLPEWRAFCKWIETLPYSEFITNERGSE